MGTLHDQGCCQNGSFATKSTWLPGGDVILTAASELNVSKQVNTDVQYLNDDFSIVHVYSPKLKL